MLGSIIQQQLKPNEYGFTTTPDGTILRTDPRTGSVSPAYQAAVKPIEVNGRLVDPTSGRVLGDYSDPKTATVGNTLVNERTGQPIYQAPEKPVSVAAGGTLVDPTTGRPVYQAPDRPTNDVQEFQYARQGGYKGSFEQWQTEMKAASRSQNNVSVDTRGESSLDKALGEGVGKTFSGMYDEGVSAGADLTQINRLRGLLAQSGSGIGPSLQSAVAGFGINLGQGADAAQAANSIISYLAPRQRVPGTGASSDRDVAMFQKALPSLLNTSGGNEMILSTMEGLARYKRAQGDTAGQVLTKQLTVPQAIEAVKSIPDPFASFKAIQAQSGTQGAGQPQPGQMQPTRSQGVESVPVTSPAAVARLPPGTIFITPDGRRKVAGPAQGAR